MRLKSYIPIQTDSIEFTPRTNYSNTVILIRLNPPEITRIFTGDQVWGWLREVCAMHFCFMIRGQQVDMEYIVYCPLGW